MWSGVLKWAAYCSLLRGELRGSVREERNPEEEEDEKGLRLK